MKKLLCVLMFGLIFGRSSSLETYTNSSQVELEIDSESVVVENAGAGTLDIIMQNYPGCKDFCVDPKEEEHPNQKANQKRKQGEEGHKVPCQTRK